MTEKPPPPSRSEAELRATRLGMGSSADGVAAEAPSEHSGRATRKGLPVASLPVASVPVASVPVASVPGEELELGSRPGFDVRMPPREPSEPDVEQLEQRAVLVSKTASARVFLKPGELPEWMGIAAVGTYPRKIGTFMSGSPPAKESLEPQEEPKSSAGVTSRYGVVSPASYAKAPMTTSPAPAPYRRPLAYRPAALKEQSESEQTGSLQPSVVFSAASESSSESRASEVSGSDARGSSPSVPPLSLEMRTEPSRFKYLSAKQNTIALTVKVWAPRLLGVVAMGVALGALASFPVGNKTYAPGVLRPARGAQTVSASSTGTVLNLLVQPGAQVSKGQPLVRIESLRLDVNAERKRREWNTLQEQYVEAQRDDKALLERRNTLVSQRRALLQHRLRLKEDELVNRRRRLREIKRQFAAEQVAPIVLADARAALQATSEGRLQIDTEISTLDLQLTEQEHAERQQQRQQQLQLSTAEASAKDAERLLALSVVTAPIAGWVEAVSVAPGTVVQPGTAVARLISQASPTTIVAFVPADESLHVHEGADGTVRFDSFGDTDANDLGARIVRVSREVASPAGVEALLGASPTVPMVRVELELLDEPEYYRLQPLLRSGSPVVVSMDSVERRLIDVFWNNLEHWLG